MKTLAESFQAVAGALERRDFAGVDEADLAVVDHPHANKLYRAWVEGGRVPLPLHDDDEPGHAVEEVLVRVGSRALSADGRRLRLNVEHDGNLSIYAGDSIFIRRASPVPDPEKRR